MLAEEEKNNIDIIAIILGDYGMSDNSDMYREIGMAMDDHPLPIVPVLASVTRQKMPGMPCFKSPMRGGCSCSP